MNEFRMTRKQEEDFGKDLEIMEKLIEKGDMLEFGSKALKAFGAVALLMSEDLADKRSDNIEDLRKAASLMFGAAGKLIRITNLVSAAVNRLDEIES